MKNINATHNRPEGERSIDANYILADIPECIAHLKDEKAWETNDRNSVTLFKNPQLTMVLTILHDEVSWNDIVVDGTMVVQVLEGKVNITTDGNAFELCENKLMVLHANVEHSIYALEQSVLLLTNHANT